MSTLALDARQRAMLDEMGVKVWWPAEPVAPVAVEKTAVAAEPAAAPARSDVQAEAPVRPETTVRPTVARPAVVAAAPVVRPAPAAGDAVVLVEPPQRLYGGSAAQGGWLIVADMPPESDGRHGEPFAGDAGRLLDNMLRALQLHSGAVPVHLMRTHRGAVASNTGLRPFDESFAAHSAAVAPRLVLALGPLAAQSLLQRAEPLGKLRGRATEIAALPGVQVVATYHPAYLLRNPADKARAWADLCLAAAQLG
ncbi:uracil-DNA glycosylase [Variovorax sp. J22G21]|uniref:uracil-DNA glycosylase n=1 Tax=Variovorax fucosicus TaxID=3053517 RepID=UPI002577D8FF|nr:MULTISPECIES: uracil-DNA glycosylase [unclassified Variovorax]MDM0039556.1 uracil-DNA glycosylase [Variovorax sp. J22R193]MDM0054832.1 uracil-DNA glycosylase [Variovorax sp. J22G47]MDM0064331.1 uracil-DNA glycosylase [Variovorax sp. J22G21]